MIKGDYDMITNGMSPKLLASEAKDDSSRTNFEQGQAKMAPLFKGFQIVSRKVVSDEKVELKIKMDTDPIPGQKGRQPDLMTQPMLKVGQDWKLGGSTMEYQSSWDKEGQIETFVP